jgi:ferredoxin--NADP+ reductase
MNQPAPAPRFLPEAPGIARVLSSTRLTPDSATEVRHLVLDLDGLDCPYLEGQSLGILIPPLPDRGHGSKLRFYSIASPRAGDDGAGRTVSLCVKRMVLVDPQTGAEHPSAASDYLCGVRPGDSLAIAGPFGSTLLLPEDPATHLILVATGTGIAPFRGFLGHIFGPAGNWTGEVHLFLGARSAAECLYRDEIEAHAARPNFFAHFAFSAEEQTAEGHRAHVHHRMAEQMDRLWALLDQPSTHLYLCGKKGMEPPIEQALEQRAHRDRISWRAFHRMLQDTGRLRVETY